jgi:integrase
MNAAKKRTASSAALLPALVAASEMLSPNDLSEMSAVAAREMAAEGESANTLASYASARRYWGAWYAVRYGRALQLPVPIPVVIQFIVDHLRRAKGARGDNLVHELPAAADEALCRAGAKQKRGPLALTTVRHRLSVLAHAHVHAKVANPCEDPEVRAMLRSTTKAHALRGEVVKKQPPLTLEPLQALLATCDAGTLIDKRDRALILFAWATGGRRRSEVASADMKFLRRTTAGFAYQLLRTKTNQGGKDRPESHKPLTGDAASAMEAWLEASGIREGRIFRRIWNDGRLGDALQAESVRNIVKARSKKANLPETFSAHSLRSGFMTEGGRQQVPLHEMMAMSDHKSVTVAMGYTRQGEMAASRAAHLLGGATDREGD